MGRGRSEVGVRYVALRCLGLLAPDALLRIGWGNRVGTGLQARGGGFIAFGGPSILAQATLHDIRLHGFQDM
eukprot:9572354-Lingulodinium_polyedra.AAC.1